MKQLSLWRFRNVENETILFSPGVNLLYGENAQGKTNALEAIYYLAGLKSFRCPKYREMIAYEEKEARITGEIALQKRDVTLSCLLPRTGRRTVTKNGVKPEKLSEYMGVFRAVLFCPEHLRLVKDGPGERRGFLDGAICQLKPGYASLLNEFNRVYAQRAALFRAARENEGLLSQIEVWDSAYSKLSVKISRIRGEYVKGLAPLAGEFYHRISSGKEQLSLSYECDIDAFAQDAQEQFCRLLQKHRETEKRNLFAPKGCHKDDLLLKINGKNARFYASQGQQRSAVLSLKLSEGELSARLTGDAPVYLLDDVLSELDASRREFVLSQISTGQVIVTGCDVTGFASLPNCKRIQVHQGRYM